MSDPELAKLVFEAACEIGWPELEIHGLPLGHGKARTIPEGQYSWRKVADWVSGNGPNVFWIIIDAIDAEWKRLQEIFP